MKPKKSSLSYKLGTQQDPETTADLIRALSSYSRGEDGQAADGVTLRKNRDAALDFITRYYQSPYYKKMVGGRDMLLSDQGFEDSAEGERLRNVQFKPAYSEEYYGVMKPFKPGDEGAPFQGDLRNPGGTIEMSTYAPLIQTGDKKRVRGIDDPYTYTHELSHAAGQPTMRGFMYDGQYETGPSLGAFDRSMIEGNPSRVPPSSEAFGYPTVQDSVHRRRGESLQDAIDREAEDDRKKGKRPEAGMPITQAAQDIADRDYVVTGVNYDGSYYNRSKKIIYLQNPTEIAARMRAVTNRLQDRGVMDKDDFDLSYENLYKAYKDGDDQAEEILIAMGVVDMRTKEDLSNDQVGIYDAQKGRKRTVAEIAEKKFSKYLRGKI